MGQNHPPPRWPLRVFRVVEDSMRPTLEPGTLLLGVRDDRPRRGQLRVFRHPLKSTHWLVKRVGEVHASDYGSVFEAVSDNPAAARAGDSHTFGPVSASNTYRVVWPRRRPDR